MLLQTVVVAMALVAVVAVVVLATRLIHHMVAA
jgi:hypothetical protein